MKIIERLTDRISEEIEDARTYAKMAVEYREEYPDLARTVYGISLEEMDHMARLHGAASAIIEDYRRKNGDPPADMMAVYEYLHGKQIDRAADVKRIQAMYKDG